MPIQRLNHAVLYVSDVERSATFYQDVMHFRPVLTFPGRAVFLQAEGSTNDHDLGLFQMPSPAAPSSAGTTTVGLYHLAWEVNTLAELSKARAELEESGALVGQSDHGTSKSLYAKDPDDIEFEVCWLVPAELLDEDEGTGVHPLDLNSAIKRYGASTPGGR